MRIAVDFDGTIVENQYTAIGVEKPFAVKTLKRLAAEGDDIILWTARSGDLLQDAVDWCEARGLRFYAVNSNNHRSIAHQNGFKGSRKIQADVFIDDKTVGGLEPWPELYFRIQKMKRRRRRRHKKGPFARLFGRMSSYIRRQAHHKILYSYWLPQGDKAGDN